MEGEREERDKEGDRGRQTEKKKHKQIKNIQIQMHKKCIRREEGRNDMRNQVNGMLEVGRKERMERKGESRRHRQQQQQKKLTQIKKNKEETEGEMSWGEK